MGIVSAPTPTVWTGTPKLAISAILAASKSAELSAPSDTSTTAAIAPDCAPRSTFSNASPMCVTGPGGGTCSSDGSSTSVAGEREQIHGERALERRQRALGQAVDGLLQPRRVLVAVQHAARRVEQHGHGVLLRPQRLGHERRPPRQHEQRGDERRLQRAEHRGANDAEARAAAPDHDADGDRGSGDEREQAATPANRSRTRARHVHRWRESI